MEQITPPKDYFQEALKIENYFNLIDYCNKLNISICDNPEFWKQKLEDITGYKYDEELDTLNSSEFKGLYQRNLSDILYNLVYYPEQVGKRWKRIYGTNKEDLLNKAEELRKAANKVFPIKYDKTLYRRISDYPHDLSYENIRSIVGTLKPGQLIIMSLSPSSLDSSSILYVYQLGDDIRTETSDYPNFPEKLLQDTPRNRVKEIYGIDPYSEKL